MKRFSFDLESVLDLRKYREREAEVVLGKATGELSRIERDIVLVAREKARVSSERFALGYGVAELLSFDRYILRLDSDRERLIKEAAMAELKVEAARAAYLEASREREALDEVKTGEAAEYRKWLLDEEGKVLDDIAGGAYIKRRALRGEAVGEGRKNAEAGA